MPNQGAFKFAFPCANNSPKLGDPGGKHQVRRRGLQRRGARQGELRCRGPSPG